MTGGGRPWMMQPDSSGLSSSISRTISGCQQRGASPEGRAFFTPLGLSYNVKPMSRPKKAQSRSLQGVKVQVVAPTQACLFLTPMLVNLARQGVSIREAGPGLWSLEAWIPRERWLPREVRRLRAACGRLSRYFSHPLPPALQWGPEEIQGRPPRGERRFFRPFQATDRLWVIPRGWKCQPPQGQHVLEMEVRDARGTGIHPGTRGCLRLLQLVLEQEVPELALDAGTGTGVLAMAAAHLGVQEVLALDIDPHAVSVARQNVSCNGLGGRIKVRCLDVAREGGRYPLVLAHLPLKAVIKRSKALLHCVSPGGWLVLGGIWRTKAQETVARFSPQLTLIHRETEAWWTSLLFRRK